MATMQEQFNTVYAHLKKQGRPAQNEHGDCFYHAPDGTQCAIGCLIPDTRYTPGFENKTVGRILNQLDDILTEDIRFYREMQNVHDHVQSDTDFLVHIHVGFTMIAAEWGLVAP